MRAIAARSWTRSDGARNGKAAHLGVGQLALAHGGQGQDPPGRRGSAPAGRACRCGAALGPVERDPVVEHPLRQRPVELVAALGRDPQQRHHQLRPAGAQVGACGPERGARLGGRIEPGVVGQAGEAVGGGGHLAGAPSLEARPARARAHRRRRGLGRPRLGRARGLAAQGQLVDAWRLRQVGLALEPGRELGIAGARRFRGEVARGQDMAEQQIVLQLADQPLGARPSRAGAAGRRSGGSARGRRQPSRAAGGRARAPRRSRRTGWRAVLAWARPRPARRRPARASSAKRSASLMPPPRPAAGAGVRRSRQASRFCRGWRSR